MAWWWWAAQRPAEGSLMDFFGGLFGFNSAEFYSRHNGGGIPNVKPKRRSSVKSKSEEVRGLKPH